jgi:hypothetical protein
MVTIRSFNCVLTVFCITKVMLDWKLIYILSIIGSTVGTPHLKIPHCCCLPKYVSISFANIFPVSFFQLCFPYMLKIFSGVCSVQIKMTIYTHIAQKPSVNGTQQVPVSLERNKLVTGCKTWYSSGYFIKCSHMPSLSLIPVVSWLLSDGSTYQILNVLKMFPPKLKDTCFFGTVGKSTCCTSK